MDLYGRMLGVRRVLRRWYPPFWHFLSFVWWKTRLAVPAFEPRFFAQLRSVGAEPTPTSAGANPSKVLFFATRQDRDHVAMVTSLAFALEVRGHATTVLGCDRSLRDTCNYGNYPGLSGFACAACHAYARHTHDVAGHPTLWLGQFVPAGARERAEALVNALAPEDYPAFRYRDYHLGRIVRQSVAHYLRTDKLTADAASVSTYREWLISGVWLVDACEGLMLANRPDVVVLLNGLFAPEWIMMEVAQRHTVRTVAWEVGFRPETFFFQHDRYTDMCDNSYWPPFRDKPLLPSESARLDNYVKERETGGGFLINYFPRLNSSEPDIRSQYGIAPDKTTFLLFPNITWDSTLFEKDVAFNGMADWIVETIRFIAGRPDAQLVIRVHPAESILEGADRDSVLDLLRRAFPELPPNVIVVAPDSGVSSYVLMHLADCGLVYGSTTGLELGVRGIPVVVAGQIYYRGLGFTFDPKTREEYVSTLRRFADGEIPKRDAAKLELWRRYAYFALFRAAVPLKQVSYKAVGTLPELGYSTLEELTETSDPNLDIVCKGIVDGSPFLAATP
jgi:hypothetical protein